MKIFLGLLVVVSCAVHHGASLAYGREGENWRTNPIFLNPTSGIRNPLLLGSSASLTVLNNLQNIRHKLEEIEKKNNDLPLVSPDRSAENQFQSINAFIDDVSGSNDNRERTNSFQTQPFSLLEKIPVMPPALDGYFMMFRLKQNSSSTVPAKSQSVFNGNEQQQYIQQLNAQKMGQPISQPQPFAAQNQMPSQQESHNNQQIHVRRISIQEQSSNDHQNLGNRQHLENNRQTQHSELQKSVSQHQATRDQRSSGVSQQFGGNTERNAVNGQQNQHTPISNEQTSINQQHSPRNHQQTVQQQSTVNAQQAHGHQDILRINHHSTINQQIRPQEIVTERTSNMPTTDSTVKVVNNLEHLSGPQMQTFADELLAKIQNQALNRESQGLLFDNIIANTHPGMISAGVTSHQTSLLADLERSTAVPVLETTSGNYHSQNAQLSSGASVKQHLKTPYATYDFTHLL